jgi:Zn-dependent protease
MLVVGMLPTEQGSIRLFRFAGIQVYLHWSWFIVALYEVNARGRAYSSPVWNLLEYMALFSIVLLHEFGHSLACRQVGGKADRIVLWPFGGVAYVAPPQRPGATLWSIVAGPLVNVVLAPILTALLIIGAGMGLSDSMPNLYAWIHNVWSINLMLLVFNLLPVYPLDGGQILRSLLWFVLGRARSLSVAAVIGVLGAVGFLVLAFTLPSLLFDKVWIGFIAAFMLMNCWSGLKQAAILGRISRLPRRDGFACPVCGEPPLRGPVWRCNSCQQPVDAFEVRGACPHCGSAILSATCIDCGTESPLATWGHATNLPPAPPHLTSNQL